MIVDGKHGLGNETNFDFKYIPDLHKKTVMEDLEVTGVKQPGIERRNLQALVIGCGFFIATAFFGLKILSSLIGRLLTTMLR